MCVFAARAVEFDFNGFVYTYMSSKNVLPSSDDLYMVNTYLIHKCCGLVYTYVRLNRGTQSVCFVNRCDISPVKLTTFLGKTILLENVY